jgi:septal ring factor EnvC (AmiA/AmiB activator)
MKQFLTVVLALVCIALVIAVVMIKRGDDAQHDTDTGVITDFSNRLDTAQGQVAYYNGQTMILSNSLDAYQSVALTFSNSLQEAESNIASDLEQITNLNRQVTEVQSENVAWGQHATDLTNQMAVLSNQLAVTQASLVQTNQDLDQAYKDYGLLENRYRMSVAEQVVTERRFYNPAELKAQLVRLKEYPFEIISSESIYAGMQVEVNSNGSFHVLPGN